MVASVVAAPYTLEQRSRWLVARFSEPWNVLSWCVLNGGFQRTRTVAWLYLLQNEIAAVSEPADWFLAAAHDECLSDAVGFMTTRRSHSHVESKAEEGNCRAWAIGTVGLSNALRAGDRPEIALQGTINLLVCVNTPLVTEAAIEALCLVGEAKTLAVLESKTRSGMSRAPATGTGTDYLAIAWPATGEVARYAGKHTALGAAIGRAALDAVKCGIAHWQRENGVPE